MDTIVYVIIGLAAVLGAIGATYRIRARQRLKGKLDRIIELLERRPS
jgi:uncharacterized membrane protein YuzA (DUF378 family)